MTEWPLQYERDTAKRKRCGSPPSFAFWTENELKAAIRGPDEVNVVENPGVQKRFKVDGFPTLLFFSHGKKLPNFATAGLCRGLDETSYSTG